MPTSTLSSTRAGSLVLREPGRALRTKDLIFLLMAFTRSSQEMCEMVSVPHVYRYYISGERKVTR